MLGRRRAGRGRHGRRDGQPAGQAPSGRALFCEQLAGPLAGPQNAPQLHAARGRPGLAGTGHPRRGQQHRALRGGVGHGALGAAQRRPAGRSVLPRHHPVERRQHAGAPVDQPASVRSQRALCPGASDTHRRCAAAAGTRRCRALSASRRSRSPCCPAALPILAPPTEEARRLAPSAPA